MKMYGNYGIKLGEIIAEGESAGLYLKEVYNLRIETIEQALQIIKIVGSPEFIVFKELDREHQNAVIISDGIKKSREKLYEKPN